MMTTHFQSIILRINVWPFVRNASLPLLRQVALCCLFVLLVEVLNKQFVGHIEERQ